MSFFNRFKGLFVWLLVLVGLLPGGASACGGFFCSATPVDQQAERMLFVQEDEYTVRSTVEIQYQGDPENFAWVVPVPSVPELDTFSPQALQALDLATAPFYIPAGQCSDDLVVDADGGPPRADSVTVDVLDRRLVGPFDTATIESRDPDALVEWLRIHDFRVPEQMEPFIALYVNEGMKFLAMKLQPGRRVDAILPISMRYFARSPAVPLRLTAIAALPEMGVKVWVLADRRYGALNVPAIQVPLERVRYDVSDRKSNHGALVARLVDEQQAPAFVTEYAQPTGPLADRVADAFVPRPPDEEALEARDTLEALLRSKPYITRLYTRVSPEEMHVDPIFGPIDGGDVSNVHELPESAIAHCSRPAGGEPPDSADACEFAACGQAGRCAAIATNEPDFDIPGCACAEGTVARAMLDPDARGRARIACVDARMNFTESFLDPRAQSPCGSRGECVSLNGTASCRCDVGLVAVARIQRSVESVVIGALPRCLEPKVPLPDDFLAGLVPFEPNLPYPGRPGPMAPPADVNPSPNGEASTAPPRRGTPTADTADSGCSTASTRGVAPLGGLFVVLGLGRARRRRFA